MIESHDMETVIFILFNRSTVREALLRRKACEDKNFVAHIFEFLRRRIGQNLGPRDMFRKELVYGK